jgi:hypothetical protein
MVGGATFLNGSVQLIASAPSSDILPAGYLAESSVLLTNIRIQE